MTEGWPSSVTSSSRSEGMAGLVRLLLDSRTFFFLPGGTMRMGDPMPLAVMSPAGSGFSPGSEDLPQETAELRRTARRRRWLFMMNPGCFPCVRAKPRA